MRRGQIFLRPVKKVGASTEHASVAQALALVACFQRIPRCDLRIMRQGFEAEDHLVATPVLLAGGVTNVIGQIEEQPFDLGHVAVQARQSLEPANP